MSTTKQDQQDIPSTSTPQNQKFQWLCVMPDKPDALQRRLEVRFEHLAHMKSEQQKGFILFGGVMLGKHSEENEAPDFKGSTILAYASSKEEVVGVLKEDAYTRADVWDWDAAQIISFKTAFVSPSLRGYNN